MRSSWVSEGIKGYKLWNLNKKRFLISRDVIFEEHMFPFKSEQAQTYYEDYKVMLSIESGEIGNIINLAEMEIDHDRYKPLDTG